MTYTSRLSPKGQTTVPMAIQKQLGLSPGTTLTWKITRNEANMPIMEVSGPSIATLLALRGSAKGIYGKTKEEIDAYLENERASWD